MVSRLASAESLPPGVDRGLWDYLHAADMVAGYDEQMRASHLARADLAFCEHAFRTPGRLLDLMNQQRLKEGIPVLRANPALERVALARANNLVANGYFDHYSPDGESAFSELAARSIQYRLAGENLARNNYPETRTVQAAFDGLMASQGHRANILESRFTQAGVAAVRSGKMWVYVTVFMD